MPKGRRGYYKQPSSIWREPWSNDDLAGLVRLQAYLHECWARDGLSDEEAGRATLSLAVLKVITGRSRRDIAEMSARRWADVVSMSVELRGEVIEINWPKWAEFQFNFGRFALESRGKKGLSENRKSDSEQRTAKEEEEPPTPVATAPEPPALEQPPERIRPIHADPSKANARLIWPECQKAAGQYGKRWETLNSARLAQMAQRLREHGPDPQVLVRAIHGAMAYWKKTMPDKDMLGYLTPDTLYRGSKFAKYLEFATDPKTAPQKPVEEMTLAEKHELQRAFGLRR